MKILSVNDKEFNDYGCILDCYEVSDLLKKCEEVSEKPKDNVIYIPSDKNLEDLPIYNEIKNRAYGGMDIQFGYCNGFNKKLNCLEYHRGCEINIPLDDIVLLVAKKQDIIENKINTDKVVAFKAKKGDVILLYETTLHYAPCALSDDGFRVVIILPRFTNTDKPVVEVKNAEDKLLWAKNKWLIAHKDTTEANEGAVVGLIGKNIEI